MGGRGDGMGIVALTARDMNDMGRLAQLAANPQDTTREEIYLAVASLYRVQGTHLNERERGLMREILSRLTRDVEMTIRIAMAERLADDPAVPTDLVLLLCDDAIEVARPVILRSPLLSDEDMLQLIARSDTGHHEAIAARPYIGESVTATLAQSQVQSVLLALVKNATAKITPDTFEVLVEKSRAIAELQDPIVKRKDLPGVLAGKMCSFVSETLKSYIAQSFAIAPAKVDHALIGVEQIILNPPPPAKPTPAESAHKLVEKLFTAGQLKAGFLLRVLHQGQIDLFDLAFAKLLNLSLGETRQNLYERGAKSVALACRAVSIDRCVFATVYKLSRQARMMKANLTQSDMEIADNTFAAYTKSAAYDELQAASRRG